MDLYRVARAYQKKGDLKNADLWYGKALELAGQNLNLKAEWAALKLELGQWREAEILIDEVLSWNPGHALSLNNKGWLLMNRRDFQGAKEYLEKAVLMDPDYELALYNLSILYRTTGNTQKSREYAKRVLRLNPGNLRAKQIAGS